MTLGEIMVLRKAMGMSRSQLAEELGIPPPDWQAVECGRAELQRIHILAIERLSLRFAASTGSTEAIPADVRDDACAVIRRELDDENFRKLFLSDLER
ncbi:transcriptional regulator with XRE-family HTH domain [Bosea sp. OAE752]|uniref:helix-turn-helix domain-containing protein n=1 Tax=unclassified Bosea (in: a-proteobacteria) TaxID=2653178 RepID=UPI00056E2D43|nr:helix-turn-helix transcriptional regulator [Bosea sp. UNC402CLCol]